MILTTPRFPPIPKAGWEAFSVAVRDPRGKWEGPPKSPVIIDQNTSQPPWEKCFPSGPLGSVFTMLPISQGGRRPGLCDRAAVIEVMHRAQVCTARVVECPSGLAQSVDTGQQVASLGVDGLAFAGRRAGPRTRTHGHVCAPSRSRRPLGCAEGRPEVVGHLAHLSGRHAVPTGVAVFAPHEPSHGEVRVAPGRQIARGDELAGHLSTAVGGSASAGLLVDVDGEHETIIGSRAAYLKVSPRARCGRGPEFTARNPRVAKVTP